MTVTKKKMQRRGRVLLVVAGLLAVSGVLRVTTDLGPAIAQSVEREDPEMVPVQSVPQLADLDAAVAAIQSREAALVERERQFEVRFAALELAEAEFTETTRRLSEAEERLRATLAPTDAAAETDLARLTSVYENMQPDAAVPLFQKMDAGFAAGFLARMRPDAAAQILAGLEPDQAYSVSVILAGRNALAGEIER